MESPDLYNYLCKERALIVMDPQKVLTFMAKSPARKNVLSPISDKKISVNAARKPDLPKAEFAAHS